MKNVVQPHIPLGKAAFSLGMSKRWVRDKIKAGDLEALKFGNKIVVTVASINELLNRSRISPKVTDR